MAETTIVIEENVGTSGLIQPTSAAVQLDQPQVLQSVPQMLQPAQAVAPPPRPENVHQIERAFRDGKCKAMTYLIMSSISFAFCIGFTAIWGDSTSAKQLGWHAGYSMRNLLGLVDPAAVVIVPIVLLWLFHALSMSGAVLMLLAFGKRIGGQKSQTMASTGGSLAMAGSILSGLMGLTLGIILLVLLVMSTLSLVVSTATDTGKVSIEAAVDGKDADAAISGHFANAVNFMKNHVMMYGALIAANFVFQLLLPFIACCFIGTAKRNALQYGTQLTECEAYHGPNGEDKRAIIGAAHRREMV